jgi:signal peptidase II
MPAALVLASAVAAITLDQLSKSLVSRRPAEAVAGGVGIRCSTNHRAGLVPVPRRVATLVWVAAAVLIVAVALGPSVSDMSALGLGLALGGAAGNLVDRFVRDGVLDFIVLGPWPAFNVADAALVSGVALAYWGML